MVRLTEAVMAPHDEVLRPPEAVLPPDPEQVHAVEAVFAAQEKESQQVAGLLGMWAGVAVLHDIALDTFSPPAGEIELDEEKKKKGQP